jgi:hypothetical protein
MSPPIVASLVIIGFAGTVWALLYFKLRIRKPPSGPQSCGTYTRK